MTFVYRLLLICLMTQQQGSGTVPLFWGLWHGSVVIRTCMTQRKSRVRFNTPAALNHNSDLTVIRHNETQHTVCTRSTTPPPKKKKKIFEKVPNL
jgi:hypothetical protein